MAEENSQQPCLEGNNEENFDRDRFLSRKCENRFEYDKKRGIIQEKGINLEGVEEKLPEFYQRLIDSKWICFAREPIKANHTWVREFYANALETNFGGELTTMVRGKRVPFDPATINELYGLPDADEQAYLAKVIAGDVSWLADKLQNGKQTEWVTFKSNVVSKDFIAEARIWLAIICTRVMPSTNTTDVTDPKPYVIAALLDGMEVNVGRLIVEEIKTVVGDGTRSLFFPSLITKLCKDAGVEQRPRDVRRSADCPVFPLKYKGEGTARKKRKTDTMAQLNVLDPFGQFHHATAEQGSSSTAAPGFTLPPPLPDGPHHLRYISSQVSTVHNDIRQLIAGLPTGPSATNTSTTESNDAVTLETIAAAQRSLVEQQQSLHTAQVSLDEKYDKMKKKQDRFGRRTADFLNKIMRKVSYLCGAPKDSAHPKIKYPESDEGDSPPQEGPDSE